MASGLTNAPSVYLTLPPASFFKFPPSPEPQVLAPPRADFSLARPFQIDLETYNSLLNVNIPLTVAAIYATTVYFLNTLNKRRKNRAWPISRTRPFFYFVVAHNVFLALYSAWTCVGMFNAIKQSVPSWGSEGFVGIVDSMCKMNGPRGLGNGVTWNPETSAWHARNQAVKLLGGYPDSTDVGRLWNEGLAFYGWLFYLSKFYEVLDTLIILAKGKKSSLLQTYHHSGAMLCMWAGIRFMSPPIWMFVLVNSGIHSFMYTYYTLSALGIRVPSALKRTLTTLQIAQFVVGATYAIAHLFVAYDIPVQNPYRFAHNLSTAIPSVTSLLPSATASAGLGGWLKKLMLRAAGEEGLAENVKNNRGETFGMDSIKAEQVEKAQEEIRYRWEYATVNCVDTSGQAFAIYLNVMYLAPLTYLFVTFFIRSYLGHTSSGTKHPSQNTSAAIRKSSFDAAKGVEREITEAMSVAQGGYSDHEFAVDAGPPDANEMPSASELASAAKKRARTIGDKVADAASQVKNKAGPALSNAKDTAAQKLADANAKTKDLAQKANESAKVAQAKAAPKQGEKGAGGVNRGNGEETKEKPEEESKEGSKEQSGSDSQDPVMVDGNPEAYEANVEQIMTGEEKEAQKKVQG